MPPPPVTDLPPSRGNPLDYHLVVAVSAVVMIMCRLCVILRPPGFGGAVLQLTRGRPRLTYIREKPTGDIGDLLDYFDYTWNMYDATLQDKGRTNNTYEVWNTGFQKLVGHALPIVWKLIEGLQQNQPEYVKAGRNPDRQASAESRESDARSEMSCCPTRGSPEK
ncbi:hypothetical protein HPB47_007125 [Ixodes persulcatus]|uniref:Uncharacterized protein n=1 Tax=Ixodes persulcatus TaxID=34615 RepID=A0AC60P8L3_IXOPE|nr:hypothetical protein HPB47_007125 [Ixodes persulcatus]